MLYNVIVNVNIYEAGLKKLMKTSTKDLYNFQKANGYVKRTQQCRDTFNSSSFQCGKLSRAISKKRSCEKSFKKKKFTKAYACLVDVVTMLEDKLKFEDFKTIFGKDNFYVYGSINGFRKKSEILNEPIQSNTIGKVGSKFWNGPVEWIREMAGTTSHAFDGGWLREIL